MIPVQSWSYQPYVETAQTRKPKTMTSSTQAILSVMRRMSPIELLVLRRFRRRRFNPTTLRRFVITTALISTFRVQIYDLIGKHSMIDALNQRCQKLT